MKLPKYNLAYNTRDQLHSLATNAGERKQSYIFVLFRTRTIFYPYRWVCLQRDQQSSTIIKDGLQGIGYLQNLRSYSRQFSNDIPPGSKS